MTTTEALDLYNMSIRSLVAVIALDDRHDTADVVREVSLLLTFIDSPVAFANMYDTKRKLTLSVQYHYDTLGDVTTACDEYDDAERDGARAEVAMVSADVETLED